MTGKKRSSGRFRSWRRFLVSSIALSIVGLLAILWMGSRVGRWLTVADPLVQADAIVVLAGEYPYRAMEAAEIYREGWAQQVWLTRGTSSQTDRIMERLGIQVLGSADYNLQILERQEVPRQSIRPLAGAVRNTAEEVVLIAEKLEETGGSRVIIVTSEFHTRRARWLWKKLVGDAFEVVIRPAREDPFDPDRWWRTTQDVSNVVHELLGLMNMWLGSPIAPR